jgi:aconitate decarboxylase
MYPNVTSIHAALDAFRPVLIEERLAATEIGEIQVGCGHMTFVHMAREYRPAGWATAIFSTSARCFDQVGLMPEPLRVR